MKQTNSNQKAFGGDAKLTFIVENQTFTTETQYLTGSEIKQLTNLPKESELFLSVKEPWEDEPILDQDRVDLARPEIEHFYIKTELVYTINGKEFGSTKQYIKGAVIRKQGSIPASDEIYMAIKKPWEDELIKDDELIDLARPGIEHFYSKKTMTEFCIIVNAKEHTWQEKSISYAQVVELAFGVHEENERRVYTVTYKRGPEQNPEGSMVKGDSVFVKTKMIFNVTATDKS